MTVSPDVQAFTLPPVDDTLTPFHVQVHQSAIDDLHRRLSSTRWPGGETVADWSQGVPLERARALLSTWRDTYDWREFEARINTFP